MSIRGTRKTFARLGSQKIQPFLNLAVGTLIGARPILGRNISIGSRTWLFGSRIGDNVAIAGGCRVVNTVIEGSVSVRRNCRLEEVQLGAYSYVSRDSILENLSLGRFCSVGPFVICGYGAHPTDLPSSSPVFYSTRKQCGVSFAAEDTFQEKRETAVGHDVWIGARVFIKGGVRIGNGAIIGAGAVVTKDVPDYAIVGGVPARVIRFRFSDEVIEALLESEWWNWSEDRLREMQPLFAQNDVALFVAGARSRSA